MLSRILAILIFLVPAFSGIGCQTLARVPVPISTEEIKSHLAQSGPSFAARFGKDAVPGLILVYAEFSAKRNEKGRARCIQAFKQSGNEGLLYLTQLAAEWAWYYDEYNLSHGHLMWGSFSRRMAMRFTAYSMVRVRKHFSYEELSKQFLQLIQSESRILRLGGALLLEDKVPLWLDSEFVESLLRLLEDEDPRVRRVAVNLITKLPGSGKIANAIEKAYYNETNNGVRSAMVTFAYYLGLSKDTMVELYADAARTGSEELRQCVVYNLADISPRVAITVWIHLEGLYYTNLQDVLTDKDYNAMASSDCPKKWWEERQDYSYHVPGTMVGRHNSVAINFESMKWHEPVDFETGEELGDKEKAKKIREQEDKYADTIIKAFLGDSD